MSRAPKAFNISEAVECGNLVQSAYARYTNALGKNPWTMPDGYTREQELHVTEDGKPLPFGFVASKGGTYYIVFRGTQTPLEWIDDASIEPAAFVAGWGTTTRGFLTLFDQIADQIKTWSPQKNPGPIYVTGHSLGGAIANLCAAWMFQDNPTAYTFSAPRCGDQVFAARFKQQIPNAWRVFNTEDLVPTLPEATILSGAGGGLLGLSDSVVELAIKLRLQGKLAFQHVDRPVAVTFNTGMLTGNHDLGNLLKAIQE
jgi:predicted lipase